jgi:hypothetical protein
MASALLLWRLVTFDLCLLAGIGAVLALARRREPAPLLATPEPAEAGET